MEKRLEHDSKLPIIVASDHGVEQKCARCGNTVITLTPIEGEAVCERCHNMLQELVVASTEHGFHFGY